MYNITDAILATADRKKKSQ